MNFQYRVRDPLGNVHAGEIEAASGEDATLDRAVRPKRLDEYIGQLALREQLGMEIL